jgi:ribosomal protein S27AE
MPPARSKEDPMDLFPKAQYPDVRDGEREARPQAKAEPCDICGAPMQEHHCKLVCGSCGFTRDCSDP